VLVLKVRNGSGGDKWIVVKTEAGLPWNKKIDSVANQ